MRNKLILIIFVILFIGLVKADPISIYNVDISNNFSYDILTSKYYIDRDNGKIEVGTNGEVKLSKWEDEASIILSRPTEGVNLSYYFKDDKLKYDVILTEHPKSNIIDFNIETKNLTFYYQSLELSPDYDETCNITDCHGIHTPIDVVGSYAVYHTYHTSHVQNANDKDYRTGKAYHIYRPLIIDSKENKVWGELHLDERNGILSIIIPQDFLDKAVYPVIIDPVIGDQTPGVSTLDAGCPGGTARVLSDGSQVFNYLTSDGTQTITEFHVYLKTALIFGADSEACIYEYDPFADDFNGVPTNQHSSPETLSPGVTTIAGWKNKTGLSIATTNGVDYVMAVGQPTSSCIIFYGDLHSSISWDEGQNDIVNDPWDHDIYNQLFNPSMFFVYEVSSGGDCWSVISLGGKDVTYVPVGCTYPVGVGTLQNVSE